MAFRIFKRFRELLDVDWDNIADGDAVVRDGDTLTGGTAGGGGGAPTTVDYLVGTASGDLSAEIVVGTSPGGEFGGTWASPTVDTIHSGSSHASVQAAAEATAAGELATHSADTTGVHGIADTSALALSSGVPSNATFNDHSARHEDGGADEISLTGLSGTPAALTTHEADTTSVHGISDTSALALTADVVTKALFDANTILKADSDNTPAALTMGASTILARLAAGSIVAATPTELRTLLDVPTNAEAVLDSLVDAKGDLLAGTADNTVARVAVGATNGMVLEVASGASPGVQWDLPSGWQFDYVEFTGNVAISGTNIAGAQTVVTGNSISLDGSTTIVVEFYSYNVATGTSSGSGIAIDLFDSATDLGLLSFQSTPAAAALGIPVRVARQLTPSAGSHQYIVKAYRTNSNGSINAGAGGAGNGVPGFIRVTKV